MLTLRTWMQELRLRLLHLFFDTRYLAHRVGDLPEQIHERRIYLVGESEAPWLIAFQCPCGCGSLIQLNTLKEAKPRWTYEYHRFEHISLDPSVWRKVGCKSHFWIRKGKVVWC